MKAKKESRSSRRALAIERSSPVPTARTPPDISVRSAAAMRATMSACSGPARVMRGALTVDARPRLSQPESAQPREHDVTERRDLRLRRRERLERHQVEIPHAELGHVRDPIRAILGRADETVCV